MPDCVFCKIVQGGISARIIKQNERALAFLDAFPLAAGHTLIVPKAHCIKVQDMSREDSAAVFALAHEVVPLVEKAAGTGASLIAVHNGKEAGQEVPHLHVHIIPRKPGDGAGPVHSMFRKPGISAEEMDEVLAKMS